MKRSARSGSPGELPEPLMPVPEPEDPYSIRASIPALIHQRVSIKHGDAFVVADRRGDLPAGGGETGFYRAGTRHLSALELRVDGKKPVLLSSSLSDDDVLLMSMATNPDAGSDGLPTHSLLFARELTLKDGRLFERIEVRSFHGAEIALPVELHFAADFRDVFEVRGYRRPARGELLPPATQDRSMATLTYAGLDGVVRRTAVVFDPVPDVLEPLVARFRLVLAPGSSKTIEVAASAGPAATSDPPAVGTRAAAARLRSEHAAWDRGVTRVFTSNETLNALLERASADLRLMCTRTPEGLVPYAGIPWYVCPFGRDAIWTSLMALSLQPKIAAGTLRYLARRQSSRFDDFTDAEPGKILHEERCGEMANLREIPFVPYYGSVDATPLFVVLLERYLRWTGDGDLAGELWPAAKDAIAWVLGPGDPDADGFVEYRRRSPIGLTNHGWKDSHDSVFHADGRLAEGPIALVEAQAYAYAALSSGSSLARLRGDAAFADELAERARALRDRFERSFWSEARGTYALALDGEKRRCEVVTSNPGHALWAGIADPARAARVAERLLTPRAFSGWGVRTVAEEEARYNPMSYHNGSVWPHDNAILTGGLKAYGMREAAARVAASVLDAAQTFDDRRVPELYCGFARTPRHDPTPYPVACRPQAWSAATLFSLVQTLLGLSVDGLGERAVFVSPSLPPWIEWIEVTHLAVGSKRADVRLQRTRRGGAVVTRTGGEAKVVVQK